MSILGDNEMLEKMRGERHFGIFDVIVFEHRTLFFSGEERE